MSGRPSKLKLHEQVMILQALQSQPKDYGYQYRYWSDKTLQAFIFREFGVSYHLGHIRRLRSQLTGGMWRCIQRAD